MLYVTYKGRSHLDPARPLELQQQYRNFFKLLMVLSQELVKCVRESEVTLRGHINDWHYSHR